MYPPSHRFGLPGTLLERGASPQPDRHSVRTKCDAIIERSEKDWPKASPEGDAGRRHQIGPRPVPLHPTHPSYGAVRPERGGHARIGFERARAREKDCAQRRPQADRAGGEGVIMDAEALSHIPRSGTPAARAAGWITRSVTRRARRAKRASQTFPGSPNPQPRPGRPRQCAARPNPRKQFTHFT